MIEIFEDKALVEKVKRRLPYLFQLAALENSRAGRIAMEVGSARERILAALLIYRFGKANVETEIPVTMSQVDAKLFGSPISIKTITGKRLGGVKLMWTVDPQKAAEFQKGYYPSCDILLVQINWDDVGALYYIPLEVQSRIFSEIGRQDYIRLPKAGTNPRGVEISQQALSRLVRDSQSRSIVIDWQTTEAGFDPYERWVDLWSED